jgi:hypothetical protein
MRSNALLAFLGVTVAACAPPDAPNLPVSLAAPYRDLPNPWPDRTIEPGMPVKRQLEAVVEGVSNWMKDPASVSFAGLSGVKKPARHRDRVWGGEWSQLGRRHGFQIALRWSADGPTRRPNFVVVEIGTYGKQRAMVEGLCQQSGVFRLRDDAGKGT